MLTLQLWAGPHHGIYFGMPTPNTERWSRVQIDALYRSPLLDLIHRAATVHREHHRANEIQVCTLLSIKTGGCPENCCYCPQSAHYATTIEKQDLLPLSKVVQSARLAKQHGSTRFCMGAAWRQVRDDADFDRVLEMVQAVRDEGLEVCATLGMLTEEQATRLERAGLYALITIILIPHPNITPRSSTLENTKIVCRHLRRSGKPKSLFVAVESSAWVKPMKTELG